jgi:hypothetical protein
LSPAEFQFTLTVEADDRFDGLVRDLTRHATQYARLADDAGQAFADRVAASAARSLRAASSCAMTFHCGGGVLTVTVGSEVISQPL